MRDDRLAARAASGDRSAFAELYRRYHQRLYRYCLGLVGDPEDAADALQSTMAKALSALERGEAITGVRPWLFRIAHNAAIDLIRVRRPRAPFEEVEEIESSALTTPSAASEAQSRADLAEVVSDIRRLPERQGSALVMRELSELSYADIAAALDTSPLAARQLVHQARSLLHDNRDGRTMDCDTVRRGLGETEGRRPRDRRMRAHLAACQSCAAFGSSIRSRRSALAALAPPLAPAAASEILARLLESSSTPGAGVAAGGLTAGAAKLAGASGIAKVAGAAVAGAAVVAAVGGAIVAGGALLGPDDLQGSTSPGGAQASLTPELPALRPMPRAGRPPSGATRNGERADPSSAPGGGGDGPGEPSAGAVASGADEPRSPAGPSGDGLPSVELAQSDPPVDLGAVEVPAVAGVDVDLKVPGGPSGAIDGVVDLPDRSDGSEPELPDVEIPEPTVDVPDVEVPEPSVEIPDTGSIDLPGDSGGSGVGTSQPDIPNSGAVDVPEVSVEVPDSGSVEAPDSSGVDLGSSVPGP